MVKVDVMLYIRNRMWFGWWWSYTYEPFKATRDSGQWKRDNRHYWIPVILVASTFNDPFDEEYEPGEWGKLYDTY